MVNRQTNAVITIETDQPLVASGAEPDAVTSQEMLGLLAKEIYDRATAHTRVGTQGDYLLWHLAQWQSGIEFRQEEDTNIYTFTYTLTYYTDAAQEAEVTAQAATVLSQLKLSGKSHYEKVKAIYEYICANVAYDYEDLDNESDTLKHSAYAALINKTAVCQGYANLFYLLANQAGVDTRIITGSSNDQAHAWNIVKLDGEYYNVDCTWDAGSTDQAHFLKGSDNFENHQADDSFKDPAFTSEYPISKTDYVVSQPEKPTEAEATEPSSTEPAPTEPKPTEPAPTEPKPTEPTPTEPKPTEPAPTEPKPTEPAPTEPKPTEPAPTEPKPTEPAPTEPKPTEPAPTEPKPTEPAPTEPEPTESAPTEPNPAEPSPTEPEHVGPTQSSEPVQEEPADKKGSDPLIWLILSLLGLGSVAFWVVILLRKKAEKAK